MQALLLLMAWSQILLERSCWKYRPCLFPSYSGMCVCVCVCVCVFSGSFDKIKNYIKRSQATASALVFERGKFFLGKLFVIGECGKPRNSLGHRMKAAWNRVCCCMGLSSVRFGWERLATAKLLPHYRFFPTLYVVAGVAYWKLLFFPLSSFVLILCFSVTLKEIQWGPEGYAGGTSGKKTRRPMQETRFDLAFLPGKFHGQRSVVGYEESDRTEHITFPFLVRLSDAASSSPNSSSLICPLSCPS